MKKTSKFSRFFKCFWASRSKADPNWDALLNLLIDKGEVTEISDYTITFDNKYQVWTSNHPFSSGHLLRYKGGYMGIDGHRSPHHCSKKTKIRLEDFYYDLMKKEEAPFVQDIAEYQAK
jgi:hypothetical protein